VEVDIAGVTVLIPADCTSSGPPRQYVPSATPSASGDSEADSGD
jgi:hypothetical protein